MKNKNKLMTIFILQFVVFVAAICLIIKLNEENAYLREEIAVNENNEEWIEDCLEMIPEIYELKIDKAVLEERIKWLEKEAQDLEYDYGFADQMFDDLKTLAYPLQQSTLIYFCYILYYHYSISLIFSTLIIVPVL